jgi:hypothetical protein
VDETWFQRDLPVLDATVSLLEVGGDYPEVMDISDRSGIHEDDVGRSLRAMHGEYLDLAITGDVGSWCVRSVTAAARRAVGQWSSPENVVDALAEAFGDAAEHEPDSEKKGRLGQVGAFLSTTGRDVATEVVSKVILRSAGMS